MKGLNILLFRALIVVTLLAASSASGEQLGFVAAPLIAEPAIDAEMQQRTVREGEPFLLQRLTAVRSVTLTSQVTLQARAGDQTFPAGSRLILALDVADRTEYFCASYDPRGGLSAWINGVYRIEWVCFRDTNADQSFDTVYLTPPNAGAFLPSFNRLEAPAPVAVSYTFDAENERYYFERAIMYEPSFNLYGRLFFYAKARRQTDSEWSHIASIGRGVRGGYISVSPRNLPTAFELAGARVSLVARDDGEVTVRPESAPTGILVFSVY